MATLDDVLAGHAEEPAELRRFAESIPRWIAPGVVNGFRKLHEETGDVRWIWAARRVIRANNLAPQEWVDEYLDGVGERLLERRSKRVDSHAYKALGISQKGQQERDFDEILTKVRVTCLVHDEERKKLERLYPGRRSDSFLVVEALLRDKGVTLHGKAVTDSQLRNYYDKFKELLELPLF